LGVKEPAFGHPFLLLDQDAMHHRDLARRAAEAQKSDAQPDAERLAERDAVAGFRRLGNDGHIVHFFLPELIVGERCGSSTASRHQR
jgi:hypothetical protein